MSSTPPLSSEELPDKLKDDAHTGVTGVQLERNFSFLAILGVAFSILNSWTGEPSNRLSKR